MLTNTSGIIGTTTVFYSKGRLLGSESFVVKLEKILDRILKPKKAGRKPKK
jgi:hypothetical protein